MIAVNLHIFQIFWNNEKNTQIFGFILRNPSKEPGY